MKQNVGNMECDKQICSRIDPPNKCNLIGVNARTRKTKQTIQKPSSYTCDSPVQSTWSTSDQCAEGLSQELL